MWAAVGFLSCVGPAVSSEIASLAEGSITEVTAVELLSSVGRHVNFYTAFLLAFGNRSITLLTDTVFHLCVFM